jgi:CDP-glucose 4,6-dehydratase
VRDVVEALIAAWGGGSWGDRHDPAAPHEAGLLRLSIDKAQARLGWTPRWRFEETFRRTVEWYRAFHEGAPPDALAALCRSQTHAYMES